MKRLLLATLLSLAALAPASAAPPADEAVFVEGTRYDAVLSASRGDWRLLPLTGSEVRLRLAPRCEPGAAPPRGLWLLSQDEHGRPELVADIASVIGLEAEALRAGLESEVARNDLRDAVAASLERGVFGSPFFIVDGEPFWGSDRLEQLDEWLATGGW